jgi:hypothetical protein
MSPRTVLIGTVASVLLLVIIIELVRRRRLRIGYSLLWLFVGMMALVLVLFRDLASFASQLMGIALPRSLLFSVGIACAILILLEHSLTLTILWRQNKNLAQDQALLEWRVRQLEAQLEEENATLSPDPDMIIPDRRFEEEAQEDRVHATG